MGNQKINKSEAGSQYLMDCARVKEILYVPDTTNLPPDMQHAHFEHHAVASFIVVPVQRHEEVLGLIYLENVATAQVEQRSLLAWLHMLQQHAGIAISNAQLLDNQQKLNIELQQQEQKRIETMVRTQEKERERIAADLHDHLGQMLALVRMNFSRLEESITSQYALFTETCQLLDESCSEIRRIAHDIMSPDFEKRTLSSILESLVRKYATAGGLQYTFTADEPSIQLSSLIQLNLYRLLQEILTNVLKHAQAKHIGVTLSMERPMLHLIIEDDGKGFDTQFGSEGLGLRNIHTRINLLKGTLSVNSSIGQGTIFHLNIPIL